VSQLTSLCFLEQLTLANNPMIVQPEDIRKQFDYRPFVINWCLSIRVLDGMLVGAKERCVVRCLHLKTAKRGRIQKKN
jgi:centrosomal protein CEP97